MQKIYKRSFYLINEVLITISRARVSFRGTFGFGLKRVGMKAIISAFVEIPDSSQGWGFLGYQSLDPGSCSTQLLRQM